MVQLDSLIVVVRLAAFVPALTNANSAGLLIPLLASRRKKGWL
jgi:hypothetical protein